MLLGPELVTLICEPFPEIGMRGQGLMKLQQLLSQFLLFHLEKDCRRALFSAETEEAEEAPQKVSDAPEHTLEP
jgi:hypothetical protein